MMMTCKEHDALLLLEAEGALSAEDKARLLAHEAECPDCADRAEKLRTLQEDLTSLMEEDLPLPEGFRQGWMAKVEEEAMEKKELDFKQETPRKRKGLSSSRKRGLSAAAALVLVFGGTLLTKDMLDPTAGKLSRTAAQPETAVYYSTGSETNDTMMATESAYDAGSVSSRAAGLYAAAGATDSAAEDAAKIIRTADVTLGTTHFDDDLAALKALCADCGGRVTYASVSGEAAKNARRGYLTLRIPAAKLDELLDGTAATGRVISRSETSEDVTDAYTDTAARLATQQAKMARLRALMSETATLTELIELESAIADTQYQIDALTGSLQYTDDRVSYATVELTLREESPADTAVVKELSLGERIVSGLQTGLTSFTAFLADCAVFLAAALPYLAVLAVVIVLFRLIRRGAKRERKEK